MRVLYVDDDRINTLLFEEACRLADGLVVETAASGAEALELVADFDPDVLVIDLHLPDTDGYRLLPALRQRHGRPDAPAFLCTADDNARLDPRAREVGFQACWPKPVELRSMLDELSRCGGPARPA